MRPPREDTEPWYKQFWPWFLISLPLSVVIASIVTINIAIESDDGLVSDDYYKEGLAIHMDAESAAKAKALGIAGKIRFDAETGALTLLLDKPLATSDRQLTLEVVHPTMPNQDQTIQLTASGERQFVGRLQPLNTANWKVAVRPEDQSWRIEGRLAVPPRGDNRLD